MTKTVKSPKRFEIARPEPMRVHKNLVIRALSAHPEHFREMFPEDCPYKNAQEAIDALRAHPAEWIINGILSTEDDA